VPAANERADQQRQIEEEDAQAPQNRRHPLARFPGESGAQAANTRRVEAIAESRETIMGRKESADHAAVDEKERPCRPRAERAPSFPCLPLPRSAVASAASSA